MPDIFISYRREDSSGHAGRLFDCIRERFGDESVFMDVTDISPGDDFTVALDGALASCRVVLVVIGPHWLTSAASDGRRRLDDAGDHLRMEVAHALQRNARVIPVLVRGGEMPQEHDLPGDLQALARRQAHEVSDSRWSFDSDQLIRVIEQALGAPARDALKGVPYNRGDVRDNAGGVGDGLQAVPNVTEDAPRHRKDEPRRRGDEEPSVGDGLQAVPNVARGRSMRIVAPATIFVVVIALTAYLKWSGGGRSDVVNDPSRGSGSGSVRSTAPSPEAQLPAGSDARAGVAIFRLLGGLVSRGGDGPQTVRLLIRTTNVGARYGMNISFESFRLVVGEEAIRPDEAPTEAISMQSAVDRWMTFRVPNGAAAAMLQVGDPRTGSAKIPIDLNAASPVARAATPALRWRYPVEIAVNTERRAGAMLFTAGAVRLEHYGDAVPPLEPEKLLLTIGFRVKNVGAQNGYNVTHDSFRLLIDDIPLAPAKAPIETVAYQASVTSDVVFVMPGTATTTVLQLGDVNGEHVRVPLDLSAARGR